MSIGDAAISLVDHGLERTWVTAFVVAPGLLAALPDEVDGDVLADYQAIALWVAICRLVERGTSIDLASVRIELVAWAGHREIHWYERPSPAWPWSLTEVAGVLAERLRRDQLPIAAWTATLVRLAARRRALLELDDDIAIEPVVRTAA